MAKATLNEIAKTWAEHKRLDRAMKRASLVDAKPLREQGAENWKKLTDQLDSLSGE